MIFLKLGGSLITEKSETETARLEVIDRLAAEIQDVRGENPDLSILIGHGSGSFGHHAAAKYGTHLGASTNEDWKGVVAVWKAANKLHRIVVDSLLAAGLPVISFPPSASALAHDGELISLAIQPIQQALLQGLIPVTHGDMVFDETRGSAIASTEALFSYLTEKIKPSYILLAGLTPGVFDRSGKIISSITPADLDKLSFTDTEQRDVTWGMETKVKYALTFSKRLPGTEVRIFSGEVPGQLREVLLGSPKGTLITQ
ncbi:MAG: isopentenyl phosphate kinase [Anaerolineales bacterium]|nr:isopentenyl phosphate kinase [Anaerolineales bacterium]